jgi:putative hydrolase of the HAD superfamily
LWRWQGSADALLDQWFAAENVRHEELLAVVVQLRQAGVRCYIATDQEKYRAQYLKNVMFKDDFDGYFVSCDLGVTKIETAFFEKILAALRSELPGLQPADVIFFDDSESKVKTAQVAGLDARLYKSVEQVRS